MISLEKCMIFIPLQKLSNNVGDLGKIIVATSFDQLPKSLNLVMLLTILVRLLMLCFLTLWQMLFLLLSLQLVLFFMLVAVVEVQRYWNRFKQLGCDKKGFINVIQFQESAFLEINESHRDEVFVRHPEAVILNNEKQSD